MGVYKTQVMYRTDSGRELAVSDMQSSHLLNAINHHLKQVETINYVGREFGFTGTYLQQRKVDLQDTIRILATELASRPVEEDFDEVFHDHDEGYGRGW